jgi:hypothetical protein
MNESPDPHAAKPEKTWLSPLLFILGVLFVIGAVIGFLSGRSGFMAGLCGLAIAAVFFALALTLDYLSEIVWRLRRLEDRAKPGRDEP